MVNSFAKQLTLSCSPAADNQLIIKLLGLGIAGRAMGNVQPSDTDSIDCLVHQHRVQRRELLGLLYLFHQRRRTLRQTQAPSMRCG